jgi:hypothetical protein
MMDEQAKLAQSEFKRTGKIRVIVQDNGWEHPLLADLVK